MNYRRRQVEQREKNNKCVTEERKEVLSAARKDETEVLNDRTIQHAHEQEERRKRKKIRSPKRAKIGQQRQMLICCVQAWGTIAAGQPVSKEKRKLSLAKHFCFGRKKTRFVGAYFNATGVS